MGFNKRKMEDARRQEAEKEAAARRATDRQILEDADHLITVGTSARPSECPCCSRRPSARPLRRAIGSCGRAARPAAPLAMSTCGRSTGTAAQP